LVVITTNLPPVICGVGDFTVRLLKELALQRPVTFILPETPERNDHIDPANRDLIVVPRSASALRRVLHDLGPCDLILHYSGYGYHSWGYPRWLVKAVRDWRCDCSGELTVLFHETWGKPLIRKPKTQIEPLHRRLVASLANAADHVYTHTLEKAYALRPFVQRGRLALLPVGSTIPCPLDPGDSDSPERSGVLALFGLPGTRTRVLRSFGAQLQSLAERGRFRRLLVIGEDDNRDIPAALHGLDIVRLGNLDPEGVSAALLRAEFGLTDEGLPTYAKSSVFAAYAAHGLGILTSHPDLAREEPLASVTSPAELLQSSPPSPYELRRRSRCLRNWYLQHADWPVVARILKPILSVEVPASDLDPTT
jgi:hypothetical protein